MTTPTSPTPDYPGTITTDDGATIQVRPSGQIPTTFPPGYEHPELKRMIDAAEPTDAEGLGTDWTGLGTKMQSFADSLRHIATSSEAQWVGLAGDAARGALLSLGEWSSTTGSEAPPSTRRPDAPSA